MKSSQNYGELYGSSIVAFNLRDELSEIAKCRNVKVRLKLNGDDRDRTGNLLVANQSLYGVKTRRNILSINGLRIMVSTQAFCRNCQEFAGNCTI